MANRRMATDGSEADVDDGGFASQAKGFRMAFSDPKVRVVMYLRSMS